MSTNSKLRILVFCLFLLLCSNQARSQATVGMPAFNSFGGGPDAINLSNLNVHLSIPILHKKGRMTDFGYNLAYDTSVWYPVSSGSTMVWTSVANFGWTAETQAYKGTGYITYRTGTVKCFQGQNWWTQPTAAGFFYRDSFGTGHSFSGIPELGTCNGPADASSVATDGSGDTMYASQTGAYIVTAAGQVVYPPLNINTGSANFTDRNGNKLTVDTSGHFYDTLSSTTPTLTIAGAGSPTSPKTFAYTAPSGASASYSMKYTNYTVHTNFACSTVSEFGPSTIALVSEIDLPDFAANPNDKYTFTYETTPGYSGQVTGRLASVKLPTGGTISYTYTGGSNGINCSDGSAAGLERYTPDSGAAYWNYARATGSGNARTTTITDPQGNVTVIQFQSLYETQRQIYQGAASPSNLLETITTCYNGNTSNCTSTSFSSPITQRNITTLLSGGQQSEHDDKWNTYGAPTETDDYDYGAPPHGALLKKVTASYVTLGNINAFRQLVTTQDGSGHTVSQIQYNYDETSPSTTTGTPQHVNVSAPWGNLTSTWTYMSSGSHLTKSSTFWDTGMPNTSTDVNGGITTYNYASGSASCYNSAVTSITEAISGLSTSTAWNCTGGVASSTTDENSQVTSTTYNDPYFWRPASIADPTGATTNFCYGLMSGSTCTVNPNQSESILTFNSGGSTVDKLTMVDSLGRIHVQQTRQAPSSSNFDSVETDYDSVGRTSRVTLPYQGTAGQTNSSIASTTTTYDALSRPLTVLDGGNGSTVYFYGNPGSQNQDVYITRNPAVIGENAKRNQFEYDGLGRLASVCEVTAGSGTWPGGACAQNTLKTGYWTTYSWDPLGNLKSLTQNAQMSGSTQTRSYVYDWMSRITQETVPEIGASGNGTAYYTYDTDATCGTSTGDLVKKVDAVGNVTCTAYDALHRRTAISYPSGSYASVTPAKRYVYDSATVNSVAMSNVKSRLAEAFTCSGSCTTKITDLGFSYSVRGEISDEYQMSPNSAGWYHANFTFWPSGAMNQISGLPTLPTFTYGLDGEGRVKTMSASTGQNPLTGTSYNSAGLATAVNFGSGDSDAFNFDPNTNRMTQYQFNVGTQLYVGKLTWNANGTLGSQNITDPFNAADTQNCSYSHDDLVRIASVNCGTTVWQQNFSYDPFGNIAKTVPTGSTGMSFQPTYSPSSNRITSLPSCTPTYDANGNSLNNCAHTYTWDSDGNHASVDGVGLTYDALGRSIEIAYPSELFYFPDGSQVLFKGQVARGGVFRLPGGAQVNYDSTQGGLISYSHADHLGSLRLTSTPARGFVSSLAYAPFGEEYATSNPNAGGNAAFTGWGSGFAFDEFDFPLRQYSSQGRWPNPDPLGRSATCPKDPQSQNRYAYVRNNPMSHTDPTGGMEEENWPEGGGGFGCDPMFDPLCDLAPMILLNSGPSSLLSTSPENRKLPWPEIPLAIFAFDDDKGSSSLEFKWNCIRNYRTPKYFGVCSYTCRPVNPPPGSSVVLSEWLVGTNQLRKLCNIDKPIVACPYVIRVSTGSPDGPSAGGFHVDGCAQDPN